LDFLDITLAARRCPAKGSWTLFGYRAMVKERRGRFGLQSARLGMMAFVDVVDSKSWLKREGLIKMGLSPSKCQPVWFSQCLTLSG
jgi:hypothetical protein